MGLIREPKNVDFTVKSTPWTEEELRDFRILMNELKSKKLLRTKVFIRQRTTRSRKKVAA